MKSTTIAAISTPFGSGGIGIIRLSGDQSVHILTALFQRTPSCEKSARVSPQSLLVSHRFYHGNIFDPYTREIIDEVLVVVMLAPKSYTRENVVEIHSHSGAVVLGKIYQKVLDAGAKIAEPGEFTKRAFLNGRIDLTQAEAVVDIINAKTGTALKIANRQLAGGLTEKISDIREALLGIRALLEVAIDFTDDVEDEIHAQAMLASLEEGVLEKIDQLLRNYEQDHFYRDGVRMAVIGRPNVGKSSLMNQLIQRERAIVTAVPGTTRDVIEETLHIQGLPVLIMDTAGLHDAQGEVEKLGIKKTRQSIKTADMVLFLVDSREPPHHEDYAIYREVSDKKHLIIQNKIDLSCGESGFVLPDTWHPDACVKISALVGTHIEDLKRAIWKVMVGDTGVVREVEIVPNLRHKSGLEQCLLSCRRARRAMIKDRPAEIIAADIMEAIGRLDKVLGNQYQPDVLDQIFSRFCIGK